MDVEETFLYIPVASTDEVVAVPIEELPEEAEDLLDILKAEEAPLSLWIDFAKAYLAQGKLKQYLKILTEGTGEDVAAHFGQEAKFERLQIFCALAAFHTAEGRSQKDRSRRVEHFTKAAELLSSARQIDYEDQLPFLGLGELDLARGDVESAKRHFEKAAEAKSNGRKNVAGVLALANLHFRQGRHKLALGLYRRALLEHPGAPAEVRLGLAACLFRLGQFKQATAAYERTLQLMPSCGEALLGLAVIAFNTQESERGLREGLDYLCRAYDADAGQPGVLTLLARFSIQRGDWQRTQELASAALQAASTDETRALALTLEGRAHHAQGRSNDAYRCYQQASKLNSKLPLPLYGLAQIMLRQREYTNAVSLLERALAEVPGWPDALNMLGMLYPQAERKGQTAFALFQEAAEANSKSGAVWEILAELLTSSDPPGALRAYKRSLELYREAARRERDQRVRMLRRAQGVRARLAAQDAENGGVATSLEADKAEEEAANKPDALPAKLLNNAAVLHMRGGEAATALELMHEAVQVAGADSGGSLPAGAQVTMGYNRARMLEANGNVQAAVREYQGILQAFPGYTDCHLRLACMAVRRDNHDEAVRWAKQALEAKPGLLDAQALLGWIFLQRKDYQQAEEIFAALTQNPLAKNDPYGLLGLAIINLSNVPPQRRKEEDHQKAEKYLNRALGYYMRVLEKYNGNIYAANGVGSVLAEQGKVDLARKVLNQVQEAAAASEGFLQMPDAFINMGTLFLALGEPQSALQVYTSVVRRALNSNDLGLLMCLARAFYDADKLDAARAVLLKVWHLDPTDHRVQFNVALTMQNFAVHMLVRADERRKEEKKKGEAVKGENASDKLEEIEKAVGDLGMAHRLFQSLLHLNVRRSGLDPPKLLKHLEYCSITHENAKRYLAKAEREHALLESRREESRLKIEAAQKQRELEAEKARLATARKEAELEQKAREAAARLKQLQANWNEEQQILQQGDEGKREKKRKRSKAQSQEADFIEEDNPRSKLAGTGLESSDEEEEYQEAAEGADDEMVEEAGGTGRAGSDAEDEGGRANGSAEALRPPSGGRKSRLHKRAREDAEVPSEVADLDDDVDAAPPADQMEEDVLEDEDGGAEDEAAVRKARHKDLFGDSEDDE